ncbi:hypothetical protein E1B28_012998 [Marasmius oreades]|uniref:Uncharacterized protein n=1 Tax=Marasmius oreades TaxID=181124 RepID=A0A9P7UPG0_9AGAR|nr:uncharacterized protein E1B28_012998 [Marasmius oreades]KAG7087019.1 hypothetical protein E1B28_012998 [Marasmius oreades]
MSPTLQLDDSHNAELEVFRGTVLSPLLITAFHFLLYGLYLPLFRASLILLQKRPQSSSRRFHQISLITLFILASIAVPLGLSFDILHVAVAYYTSPERFSRIQIVIQMCRYVILLFMGLTVDSILVFRCFVIFGYRGKRLVAGLVIAFCIIIDVCALSFSLWTEAEFLGTIGKETSLVPSAPQYVSNIFLALNAFTNFTLTSVLAGRIWWVSRKTRQLQGVWGKNPPDECFTTKLNTLVAILLETGLIYLIGLVVFILGNIGETRYDIGSVLCQVGGIAPTLLIVRVNVNGRPSDPEPEQDLYNCPGELQGQLPNYTGTRSIQSTAASEQKYPATEVYLRPQVLYSPSVARFPGPDTRLRRFTLSGPSSL